MSHFFIWDKYSRLASFVSLMEPNWTTVASAQRSKICVEMGETWVQIQLNGYNRNAYLQGEPEVRHRSGSGPVVVVRVHPDEGPGRGPDILVWVLEAGGSTIEQSDLWKVLWGMGGLFSTEEAFSLLIQRPRVRFLVSRKIYFRPRFIEQHCLVSGQCQQTNPSSYYAKRISQMQLAVKAWAKSYYKRTSLPWKGEKWQV